MRSRTTLAPAVIGLALAGAAACSGGGMDFSVPPGDFAAQNPDFRGYQSWTSYMIDDETPGGSTHVSGERNIYINHLPPAGATEFPVGTIIVKATASDGKIFARAKRGDDWNTTGAVGWEWFELKIVNNVTGINWRGVGPPSGEVYGGDPNAGCNPCHKVAVNNDYVLTPAIKLPGASGDAAATEMGGTDGGIDETANEAGAAAETGADESLHE